MSPFFEVNLLKSIGLLQLGYIFPGPEPWEMSGYVMFLVIVMLTAVGKDRTDHDETIVIGDWHRCSSGAVQISCIASRQFISSGAATEGGRGILQHVARYNNLKYLSWFHVIIRPFINFVITLT
jgi:hypothetical protein